MMKKIRCSSKGMLGLMEVCVVTVFGLSAGLVSMVANLTHQPRKKKLPLVELDTLGQQAQALKARLMVAVDADTAAFDDLMSAMRLPKATEEQQAARTAALRAATRAATEIPLTVIQMAADVAELTQPSSTLGNPATLSDSGVAAAASLTAAFGAYYNVLINLAGLDAADAQFVQETRRQAQEFLERAQAAASRTQSAVQAKLESDLA